MSYRLGNNTPPIGDLRQCGSAGLAITFGDHGIMTSRLITFGHHGDERVGEEMEESVPGQGAHRQGDQELDEMLVENPLHDGDHDHPEDAAE